VVFHPKKIQENVELTGIELNLEKTVVQYLSVMGKSVGQPDESKKVLEFNTAVRTTQMEKVDIKNYGTEDWILKPQVYTEFSQ
jgi:hypothetical protein